MVTVSVSTNADGTKVLTFSANGSADSLGEIRHLRQYIPAEFHEADGEGHPDRIAILFTAEPIHYSRVDCPSEHDDQIARPEWDAVCDPSGQPTGYAIPPHLLNRPKTWGQ